MLYYTLYSVYGTCLYTAYRLQRAFIKFVFKLFYSKLYRYLCYINTILIIKIIKLFFKESVFKYT